MREDLKTLSALETKYFVSNTLINSSRLLLSFMWANLLATAADGSFPVSRRVKLMMWSLLCCLPEQEGQQGCWQVAWWHVSSQPLLRQTEQRQTNAFYCRKYRSLPECCGTVEGREEKRILEYFEEKCKPECFLLLQSKWVRFYFCLGCLFRAKWYWTQYFSFPFSVCLMME